MTSDQLNTTFAALADPTRRAILASLAKGEATVQALASPFAISLPAISRHLKVLERAGLIERGRDAQYRPCRLRPERLKEAASWIDYYRKFWEESFDRLDRLLKTMQAEEKTKDRESTYTARRTGRPQKKEAGDVSRQRSRRKQ